MRARELAALVALAAIWGASYLFIRVTVEPLGPLVVAFLRVLIAAAGLLGYAALRRRLAMPRLSRPFLILGILNAAVPYGLIAFAELHLTASLAGILNATTPLFAAVTVAFWDRERIARKTVVGLVLGFGGVAVLVGWSPVAVDGLVLIAVVAMLVSSLSYALATVYAKRALTAVSGMDAALGQQIGGIVLLAPLALATAVTGNIDTSPSLKVTLAVLALGLLCTSLAYLLYFHLIATVGAVTTSSVTFLIPIFGIAWSALFLDETIRPSMLLGLALILASVGLVTRIRVPRPTIRRSRVGAVGASTGLRTRLEVNATTTSSTDNGSPAPPRVETQG